MTDIEKVTEKVQEFLKRWSDKDTLNIDAESMVVLVDSEHRNDEIREFLDTIWFKTIMFTGDKILMIVADKDE